MENNELQHFGVKGMKWGVRRYQNKDGTLTAAGKKRQAKEEEAAKKKAEQEEAARKQEHDYAIVDRLYEEHARPAVRACNKAYNNYKAGKIEEARKDLEEAGEHLKKIEEGAKKAYDSKRVLSSDIYLEPKWMYEEILEDQFGQRSEFIDEKARRVKHFDFDNFDDYLAHWGVKGMKWGVRRYQNKDGTLTAAGKKRYAQEMEKLKQEEKILKNKQRTKAQLDKLEAKRREVEEQKKVLSGKKTDEKKSEAEKPTAKKKPIKDMTDEELNAAVNRMRLEKTYKDLMKEQSAANKQASTSKGKAFAKAVWKDALKPGITEASKEVLKKAITGAADEAMKKK